MDFGNFHGLLFKSHFSFIMRKFQVGLVSFGASTCGIGKPGVYTKITAYLDWIEKNLKP